MTFHRELDVIIDALNDYAAGADEYEDESGEGQVAEYGATAREIVARAKQLRELPEEQLAQLVEQAQEFAASVSPRSLRV